MSSQHKLPYCQICNVPHGEDDPTHNNTQQHRFNFLLFEWNKYRKALVKNRHGVEVDIKIEQQNGFIYEYETKVNKGEHALKITPQVLLSHRNTVNFLCKVKNVRNKSSILLTDAVLLHPFPLCSIYDPNNNIGNGKYPQLAAGAEYTLVIKFTAEDEIILNTYKIPVSFNFQTVDESNADTFTIARSINISIEELKTEEEEATKSPFTGKDWPANIEIENPTQAQRYSDQFPVPEKYMKYLKYGLGEFRGMQYNDYSILSEIRKKLEPGYVTAKNYQNFWHIVLWIEEVGLMLGLQRYNMENVKMKLVQTNKLELDVPGLAEKRPSVIVGDMIDIKLHGDLYRGYRGIIKCVTDKSVIIGCVHQELTEYIGVNPDIEMDVRFIMSRLPLERQHQGVCQVVSNGMVPALFGDLNVLRNPVSFTRTIRNTEFLNPLIVNNEEQKTAVLNILNNTSSSAPYIVFGPPGTGKTITIVEAILQIKKKTNHNILVCAPANAACDMLTEKLMLHCSKDEMIRIMSETVDTSNIHEAILQYTNYESDGSFQKVTPEQLRKYRIVITTLILIGRYSRRYFPDVVFIDEAAQACEPEVTSALGMLDSGKQIILAGDPKQLGPSLSSRVSKKYGLDKSLLERLMDLDLYKNEDHNFITMLKLNFRSHSTILKLPNELFYGGQLKAVSASSQNDPLAKKFVYRSIQNQYNNRKKIKTQIGHAIEFCSVISKERREGRSPSYFNQKEMNMVLKYVQALVTLQFENEDDKVLPGQIGVVTPYVRQVHKVKTLLKSNGFENVEVGTTETFQGREKRVIIITTVRAQKDLLLYDKKYNIGFVRHDKRFNVALTRAMSKLIIIGCPLVLGTDGKWLKYIELCEELFTYCGAAYPRRTQDVISDITTKLGKVSLLDSQHQ